MKKLYLNISIWLLSTFVLGFANAQNTQDIENVDNPSDKVLLEAPPPPPPPPANGNVFHNRKRSGPKFPVCEGLKLSVKESEQCFEEEMMCFIYHNLEYPEQAKCEGIEGTVVVQFIINELGKVDNIRVVRDIDDYFENAVIKALKKSSSEITFIPANQRGKNIKIQYTIPIKFNL